MIGFRLPSSDGGLPTKKTLLHPKCKMLEDAMLLIKNLRIGRIFLSSLIITSILGYSAANAAVIYVGPQETLKTIQSGIDAASVNDTIIVRDGTYIGIGNRTIRFNGKEITLKSENGPNSCIIMATDVNQLGFIFDKGESRNSILEGFTLKSFGGYGNYGGGITCTSASPTISNCTFDSNTTRNSGGCIRNESSYPLIKNCVFLNNPGFQGAAIANWNSNPVILGCTFQGNQHLGTGTSSVIYNVNAKPEIRNCIFVENLCSLTMENNKSVPIISSCEFNNNKGGLNNHDQSSPKISFSTFRNNGIYTLTESTLTQAEFRFCSFYGSTITNQSCSPIFEYCYFYADGKVNWKGISNVRSGPQFYFCQFDGQNYSGSVAISNSSGSDPIIKNCSFRNHTNSAIYADGTSYDSIVTIEDSDFESNSGTNGGAVSSLSVLSLIIFNSNFSRNTATGNGGAIYVGQTRADIYNSIFNDNAAIGFGGAVAIISGTVILPSFVNLINNTFYQNIAQSGGASYNDQYSTPRISNCILWGDLPNEIDYERGGFNNVPVVNYSDIQGGFAGEGNITEPPSFIDPGNKNFQLSRYSPCIDNGSNNISGLPSIDIVRQPRIIDGDSNASAVADMGAYEFGDACEGDFDSNLYVNDSDLQVFALLFGEETCGTEDPCEGDLDRDQDIDGKDLFKLIADFGRTNCPAYIDLP